MRKNLSEYKIQKNGRIFELKRENGKFVVLVDGKQVAHKFSPFNYDGAFSLFLLTMRDAQ